MRTVCLLLEITEGNECNFKSFNGQTIIILKDK